MHGENGVPAAPDWFLDPVLERCIGCNETRDTCATETAQGASCCGFCSHGLHPLPATALWEGDQA